MTENRFDSTNTERVTRNVMRHQYRELTGLEKEDMTRVKDLGQEMYDLLDHIGSSRELSLAKTKVEEAVMWAVKHITR